ncbi:MAG TPA: hypothetical protein VF490_05990 [Chryseosolibacter sp.]
MRIDVITTKKILVAALAVFLFSQCSEEDVIPVDQAASSAENAVVPAQATGSVTISGIYTVYEAINDCSSCTFVVPADQAVIDGHELNLKPGAVICLDKAIKYGDVDFINLEGTEQNPIRIGTCGKK